MKTKNKKELIMFILMNIFGSVPALIISYAYFEWYGLIGCLILFFTSYKFWKYFGKHYNAKLSFSPNFTFGNKTWKLF